MSVESDLAFQEFYKNLRNIYKSEECAKLVWEAALDFARTRIEKIAVEMKHIIRGN